jgi:hypothetical protein
MTDDYDPRARRLNSDIQELIEVVDEHWREVVAETDYLERKGKLRFLRQVIDKIIEQPEWLEPDLREGAVEGVDCWFEADEFADAPAPVFLDEKPFDRPGPASGLCFFYADTGKASPLYEGEPVDSLIGPLVHHGPFIYTLEKHYATAVETAMHVMSGNLWRRLLPEGEHEGGASISASRGDRRAQPRTPTKPADPGGERHFLLCDPRGLGGGKQVLRIAIFADADAAVAAAESLSERLRIRFLVARERRKWCNR